MTTQILTHIDRHFADFICRRSTNPSDELRLAVELLSHQSGKKHVCLDLDDLAGKSLKATGLFDDDLQRITDQPLTELSPLDGEYLEKICPKMGTWKKYLLDSGLVGDEQNLSYPLILDSSDRLYLKRYWDYQTQIADNIKQRLTSTRDFSVDFNWLDPILSQLFLPSAPTESNKPEPHWQKLAALNSLSKNLSIISGGPGTGKTYTVARQLILLIEQSIRENKTLKIALAAPTGKAAMRMSESIKLAKSQLSDYNPDVLSQIPETAQTIHRLLRTIPNSPYFRFNAENPLPVNVVIIDEVSMVDIALMAKLLQAVPLESHLILVGDKYQLSSVEAGSVLGDICGDENSERFSEAFSQTWKAIEPLIAQNNYLITHPGLLNDSIVLLRQSHRFKEESGIKQLSDLVNDGQGKEAFELLKSNQSDDISWQILPDYKTLKELLKPNLKYFKPYLDAVKKEDPQEALQRYDKFRILCGLRRGIYGVHRINQLFEELILETHSWIRQSKAEAAGSFYLGQPIMVTQNDYTLNLFNGDIGLVMKGVDEKLKVVFKAHDGSLKYLSPFMLPSWEPVYAMTVHKSQGSEFDRVLMILPDTPSPVITRELIYTGMTRAKSHLELWIKETSEVTNNVFIKAINSTTERTSGLKDLLWK